MNICIFGATGRVGSLIVKKAIEDGHTVQALIRNLTHIPLSHPNLFWAEGNVLNERDVNQTVAGADVIISSLNTDGSNTLSKSMPIIIRSMNNHGLSRIVTIGTAGILQSKHEPEPYRFQSTESRNRSKKAAEDHLEAYLKLKESNLNWTVVCPTYLPDGEQTNRYRYEKTVLPDGGLSISTGDTADFAYKQLFSNEFSRERVGLSY